MVKAKEEGRNGHAKDSIKKLAMMGKIWTKVGTNPATDSWENYLTGGGFPPPDECGATTNKVLSPWTFNGFMEVGNGGRVTTNALHHT